MLRRRRSKTSRQEDKRRENCRGVRTGVVDVFVEGSWEGKIVMWRGLFCLLLVGGWMDGMGEGGEVGERYVAAYYA